MNGNDVYVGGSESNGTKFVAKVWKNGVATVLTDGAHRAAINSIYILNNDVYFTGTEESYGAVVWKNGIKSNLDQTTISEGSSVFAIETDVYVAGNTSGPQAVLWKNGQKEILGNSNAYTNSIFVTSN